MADLSDTKKRILMAAGRTFAEVGFRRATVREICERAGVNIAAVNYHFGDKERLYFAVLSHWRAEAFEKYPFDIAVDRTYPPEERLRAFVRQVLFRILDEGETSWFPKLMAREFIEPTGGLDLMVEEGIRPTFTLLSGIIEELMGGRATETDILFIAASIIGQCFHFFYARPVITRLFPEGGPGMFDKERIAGHIARFSIHAIHAMGNDKRRGEG